MLISARTWIRETFEQGSRPTLAEVAAWIQAGEVPGRVLGERVYVDADRFAVADSMPPPRPSGAELLL